ncbi:MAG: peptidyl-prolyl cis-trans isomerase [Candidatus Omnitrophica bacterium]|nr:peptidyl-prolyl cis-trans isomerase [Candidatus Omnitrophota bacterium]
MKNTRLIVSLIAFAAVIGLPGQRGGAEEKIVAVVNNEIITQRDLDSFLNFMRVQLSRQYMAGEIEDKIAVMKSDLLDRLIEDRLILQEAKKENIKIDDARITAKIEEVKKRYPAERDFENALQAQGLVVADLQQQVREQQMMLEIVNKKIRSRIIVKPSEITEYYNKNIDRFKTPEERVFDSLVGQDAAKAAETAKLLRGGKDVAAAAAASNFTASEFRARPGGQLKKEVEDVLFAMKIGDVSEPVEVKGNYYVFKLNSITPPRQQSLAETSETIHSFLYERRMQESMVTWVDELKKKSYIKKFQDKQPG